MTRRIWKMIKTLILDIDDTLIPRGHSDVVPSAVRAIDECRKKGIKIIVATGRGYYLMHPDIKKSIRPDYFITANGCSLNTADGTVIKSYPIMDEDVEELIRRCLERDYPFGFKCEDSFQIYNRYEEFCNLYESPGISRKYLNDNSQTRDHHLKGGVPLSGFIYAADGEAFNWGSEMPGLKFAVTSKAKSSVECFSINANKGVTIRYLCDHLGISTDECMAFGDSQNDIEMLKECGIGVAMGNAMDEVKKEADYITTDIFDDGIANALRHFGLIEG